MNSIKFVYFDVGGVALLDFSGTSKWQEMKKDLGVSDEKSEQFELIWQRVLPRICIDCDVDSVIPRLREVAKLPIRDNYSMLVDFVERFEINPTIWPIIHKAKAKYRVGLLTNMYPRMLELIQQKNLLPQVDWDVVVDSSVIGYQKPQPEIYQKAEELANVAGQEIIFVDNSQEHLDAAKRQGWQTFLYDPQQPEVSSQTLASFLKI